MSDGVFDELKISRDRLYEQIASQIQVMMASQRLRPDDRLPPERDLAERLGVNRATVRAAVRSLEQRGLVERRVGSGTYVTKVPASTVTEAIERYMVYGDGALDDLLVMRKCFEPHLTILAAQKATAEDYLHLEQCLRVLADEVVRGDARAIAAADVAFHLAIVDATQNSVIRAIFMALKEPTVQRLVRSGIILELREQELITHQTIYDAMREKDPDAISVAVHEHFMYARDELSTSWSGN